jgi:FkbM family methyltransferase
LQDTTRADLSYADINIANVRGIQTGMKRKTVETRHGMFTVYDEDELCGMSLMMYGEYSEGEVQVFRNVLRPGDVAIDVGANIGAFTVPMAKLVGETGQVYAFEASRYNQQLLRENVNQNKCADVVAIKACAASDQTGVLKVDKQSALHAYCRPDVNEGEFEIPRITIDSLKLPKVKLIKVDVDGHELEVLNGAEQTIKRCKPIIYIENEIDAKREAMVAWLVDHGYRLWWHRPYMYNIDNWRGEKRNIFGSLVSIMSLCVPDEEGYEVTKLEEVSDYRHDERMFDRERERYLRYVERDPGDLESRWMAAHYANLMQRRDEARALAEENLAQDPEHVPTNALLALMTLQDGVYNRDSWTGYEIRNKQPNRHKFGADRWFPEEVRRWGGEKTDEPLLIWTEQGFGDNIMFCRFMKDVLERAPNAVLESRPELFELFEYSKVVPPGHLFRLGRTLPPFSLQLSLPSVPWAIGADESMIRRGAYLDADPLLVANWKGKGNVRIGQMTEGPLHGARIGLCLKGSGESERPYSRDIPKRFIPDLVRDYGPVFPLEQQGQFDSFAMTAALIKALDLVLTVDTSVAHLAGALGVPTWLLLAYDPDFRWGLTGSKTIWYDSVRIFRQSKFRDWQSVMDEVMAELEHYPWRSS